MAGNPNHAVPVLGTKEQIALAATRLFARLGYDGTSIRDIAEASGVTKPALYYHFKSKEELYKWIIHDAYAFFLDAIEAIIRNPEADFQHRLKRLTKLYFECVTQYEDTTRLIYNAAFGTGRNLPRVDIQQLEKAHLALLAEFFEEGKRKGLIQAVPTKHILFIFTGGISSHIASRLLFEESIGEEAEDVFIQLLTGGIGAQSC